MTPLRVLGVAAGFLVVVILALAALRPDILSLHFGPYVGTCSRDGQIAASERQEADTAALSFAQSMVGPTPLAAYSRLAPEARGAGQQNFLRIAQLVQSRGPFAPLSVDHTYMLHFKVTPNGIAKIPCVGPDGAMNFVAAEAARVQAHVSLTAASAKVPQTQWTISLWLAKRASDWTVVGFNFSPSMLAGHTGRDLWRMAQQQRQRGHALNAGVLYQMSGELLQRGQDFQSSEHPAFDQDVASFKAPAELSEMRTRPWRLDGQDFPISRIGLFGVGDHQLALMIGQSQARVLTDQEAEQQDHRLIDAFVKTHPEWREAFDAIVARTYTPDSTRSYGVVYDRDKGYLTGPRGPARPVSPL